MMDFKKVEIKWMDGTSEDFNVSETPVVKDGTLHLWYQGGQYADRIHVGSFPLVNIKKWQMVKK